MLYTMKYRKNGQVHDGLMEIDTKELKVAYDYCEKFCQERASTITKFVGVNYAVLNQIPVEPPKVEQKSSGAQQTKVA